MTIHIIRRYSELSAENSVFRLQGFGGTAAANTTTDIEWAFPEERWMTGGFVIAKDVTWGDTLTIKIVDKDNVLGMGSNLVIRTFVENMRLRSDAQWQGQIDVQYVTLIPAGIYVRAQYTNTHASNAAALGINLFTHIPRA